MCIRDRIVKELPPGLSGLILGGVFAAAISSLDSILAALSQTTVSVLHSPGAINDAQQQRKLLSRSRMGVIIWGVFLTGCTLLMRWVQENTGVAILPLAFGMTTYTMGPLLGMFVCALLGRGSLSGLVAGSAVSFIAVLFIRSDIWVLLHTLEFIRMPYDWLASLPMYYTEGEGDAISLKTTVGFFWAWPATTLVTFALTTSLLPPKNDRNPDEPGRRVLISTNIPTLGSKWIGCGT